MIAAFWEPLRGWAGTRSVRCLVARVSSAAECREALAKARAEGLTVCPKGGGYSYADQILNEGQMVLDLSGMDRILGWDREAGLITTEPGASFGKILERTLPDGWTVGATVGVPGVTMGGALGNNVHGKNSWRVGDFGSQVESFKLMKADGEIVAVTRESPEGIFRAAVGGMGMLGVVVEIVVRCRRVPSPFLEIETRPSRCLRETVDILEESREKGEEFSIAWVDAFASGDALGRGFTKTGRWAESTKPVPEELLKKLLRQSTRVFGLFPAHATWALARFFYGRPFVRRANAVRYGLYARAGRSSERILFPKFNFLHNLIPDLNRIYRPHGFYEFQPLIPRRHGAAALEDILRLCQEWKAESLLCGMKLHSPDPDDCFLTYAGDSYSLGIDVHARGFDRARAGAFARALFEKTAALGGIAYAAKDEALPGDLFKRMYPRYEEFLEVKKRLDPGGLFSSDMFRRLFL